ncbi:MAG: DNA-binding protein WhiA [Clostridia bacterium]|nr:DNA-binding protein WhiA [Clostridia bacterium]
MKKTPDLTKCDKIIMGIIRNNANRAANCDSGNIAKQVKAASHQITLIEQMKKDGTLQTLSPKLQETATVRVENPDATYEELAGILHITKSGVVNRLRKIIQTHSAL